MPKKKEEEEITDPIVRAAMVEDPTDEDDKELRKKYFSDDSDDKGEAPDPSSDDEDTADEADEDEADDADSSDSGEQDKEEDEEDTSDDEDDEEDVDDKPPEAQDAGEEGDNRTRKEKREARKKAFFDSIRRDGATRTNNQNVDYNPLDYSQKEEFDPNELKEDRDKYGATQYAKGAQETQYWAEQEKFWGDTHKENEILKYDDELNVLSTELPNGKKNPKFDPDLTEEVNEMFLELVGFKRFFKTDAQGNRMFDQNTGQPLTYSTVDRTDISYEKFARRQLENLKKYANKNVEDREDEMKQNLTKQRKKQGMRPGGTSKRGIGKLTPGKISRMSDEDFEKYEEDIDRQINALL